MTLHQDDSTSFSNRLPALIYGELETRVGVRLTKGMSDGQLLEFEAIFDKDKSSLSAWLRQHSPDFDSDPQFRALEERSPGVDAFDLVAEYAASKWLEINRPDAQSIIREVQAELAAEVRSCIEQLLDTDRAAG